MRKVCIIAGYMLSLMMLVCMMSAGNLEAQVVYGFHPRMCLANYGGFDSQEEYLWESNSQAVESDSNYGNEDELSPRYYFQYKIDKNTGRLTENCALEVINVKNNEDFTNDGNEAKDEFPCSSPITLIPNPAKDEVIIKGGCNSTVYVFDFNGRQVLFSRIGDIPRLDIRSLQTGIYSLKVEGAEVIYTLQLIVQR